MSETRSVRTIGGTIAVIGVLALIIGLAMPATSTHSSETCIDDPTGFGQDCVSGSITTPNPLKGSVTGIGFLALFGGIGIILVEGRESRDRDTGPTHRQTADGGFAEKLRERQENEDASDSHPSSVDDPSAGQTRTSRTTNFEKSNRESGSWPPILPRNPLLGYGVILLVGGILGYVILFSITYWLNFVLSFWMGTLAGFFVAYHIYTDRYTSLQGIEIPLAFFGAWHGTGLLYQLLGPLPRGVLGMLMVGAGVFIGAGIAVAAWRLIGGLAIRSVRGK